MPGWLIIIICVLGTSFVIILCSSVYYLKCRRALGMGGDFLDILGKKTEKTETDKKKQINMRYLSHNLLLPLLH